MSSQVKETIAPSTQKSAIAKAHSPEFKTQKTKNFKDTNPYLPKLEPHDLHPKYKPQLAAELAAFSTLE